MILTTPNKVANEVKITKAEIARPRKLSPLAKTFAKNLSRTNEKRAIAGNKKRYIGDAKIFSPQGLE